MMRGKKFVVSTNFCSGLKKSWKMTFLLDKKKFREIIGLKFFHRNTLDDVIVFFFLNLVQKILVTNVANTKYLKIQKQKILFNYLQQNVGWLVVPRKRQLF